MYVYSINFSLIIDDFYVLWCQVMRKPALCIYENKQGAYLPVNNRSLICSFEFAALRFRYVYL